MDDTERRSTDKNKAKDIEGNSKLPVQIQCAMTMTRCMEGSEDRSGSKTAAHVHDVVTTVHCTATWCEVLLSLIFFSFGTKPQIFPSSAFANYNLTTARFKSIFFSRGHIKEYGKTCVYPA